MATIIFDFDGTIANTFDFAVEFLSREGGKYPLNKDQKEALHGLSMARIARKMGIPWHRLPGLFFKGRHQMSPAMQHVEPFDGILDVIRQLHAKRHKIFILSTNTTRNINKFLRRHDMERYFEHVYGGVGMFGKAPALRRLLREQHIETRKAIYVGDELRDIMAAQSIGVRVIAVSWGFARATDLKAQGLTGLARSTRDIIRIVEKLG
jgi:phosphoglycolate phosphatase